MLQKSFYHRFRMNARRERRSLKGFTLIELLIVIAIILILIAIALPNFLEAQIRARVTKSKAEIRSLGIAQEAYYLDWRIYPAESEADVDNRSRLQLGLAWLTTPNAYITSIPDDPFVGFDGDAENSGRVWYETGGLRTLKLPYAVQQAMETYIIFSKGPGNGPVPSSKNPHIGVNWSYSATNGTKSPGAIYQYGGDPFFIGVDINGAGDGLDQTADYAAAKTSPTPGLIDNGIMYLKRFPPPLQ